MNWKTPVTASDPGRREFLAGLAGAAVLSTFRYTNAAARESDHPVSVARVAFPSSLTLSSESKTSALNSGFTPANSYDRSHGLFALHEGDTTPGGVQWVQYVWSQPVNVDRTEVFWAVDHPRPGRVPGSGYPTIQVPREYRILYWNGA